jgi:TIR domain
MKIYITQDSSIKLKLPKLVKLLNETCQSVQFEQLKLDYQAPDKLISCPATHKKYLKHLSLKLKEDEFVILLTATQYDDNYFYNEEKGLVILTFFAWKYLTSLPMENGFVYFIAAMLFGDEVVPWDAVEHPDRQGCVNDFLYDKTRVDDGMRMGHLCEQCKQYINNHPMSERQEAVFRDCMLLLSLVATASSANTNIVDPPAVADHEGGMPESMPVPPVSIPARNKPAIGMGTTVFISYSHKDEKYRVNLEEHLKILQRLGMITTWTDRMINPGDDWKTAINDNLNNSGIILLLISSSFMASEYCYGIEMKTALERDEKDEAIAIPVILRDCLWQIGPFAKLQALPKDGKPIQKFTRKDDAYTSIAREICRIIQGN